MIATNVKPTVYRHPAPVRSAGWQAHADYHYRCASIAHLPRSRQLHRQAANDVEAGRTCRFCREALAQ